MKTTAIFLLAAVLLVGAVPTTSQAQKRKDFTIADANKLFHKMHGTHLVKTLIWQSEKKRFFEATGKAHYSMNETKTLREVFEIKQPDGTTQRYEGVLRFSAEKQRFEFVEYNSAGNATILLTGKWDPQFSMIQLEPIKRQWLLTGKKRKQIHEVFLQYFFLDDGSFKKVLRTTENTGGSAIAYEYHCRQHNLAGH